MVLRGIQPYMDEINRCRRLIMIGAGTSFHIAVAVSIRITPLSVVSCFRSEWPSGPASSISFTEVKHGCVR